MKHEVFCLNFPACLVVLQLKSQLEKRKKKDHKKYYSLHFFSFMPSCLHTLIILWKVLFFFLKTEKIKLNKSLSRTDVTKNPIGD